MGRKPLMSGPTPSKRTKGRKQNWTLAEDELFLAILKDMIVGGNNSGSFSKKQWNDVVAMYREKSGDKDIDKLNLQHRLKTLKRKYTLNLQLRSLDGWVWDNNLHMVIPPSDKAWEEQLEKNSEYIKVKQPFPQYNSMQFLYEKSIADYSENFGKTPNIKEGEGQGSFASLGSYIREGEEDGVNGGTLQLHISENDNIERSHSLFDVPLLPPLTESPPPIIVTQRNRHRNNDGDVGKRKRRTPRPEEEEEEEEENVSMDSAKEEEEKAEGLKKMKGLVGLPRRYLAAGTTALQKRELRQCILMLEGEDLAVWLQQQYVLSMSSVNNPILLQEMNCDGPILRQPDPVEKESLGTTDLVDEGCE